MALTNKLTAIADAIRTKTGGSSPLSLDDMATAIGNLSTGGGGGAVTEPLVMTSIQSYTPGTGVDGFSSVTPNLDLIIPSEAWYSTGKVAYELFGNNNFINTITIKGTPINYGAIQPDYLFQSLITSNPVNGVDTNLENFIKNKMILDFNNQVCGNRISLFANLKNVANLDIKEIKNYSNITYPANRHIMFEYLFSSCNYLETVSQKIKDFYLYLINKFGDSISYLTSTFNDCYNLKEDDFRNAIFSKVFPHINSAPQCFLNNAYYRNCEIDPFYYTGTPNTKNIQNNVFQGTGLKHFIFKPFDTTRSDYKLPSITIDFTKTGYSAANSYLNAKKRITNASTYNQLKNDEDAWTTDINYSFYNHDSAVETINSLPNYRTTKNYSSSNKGTILFAKNAGTNTDGGAINTLTSAEKAIATNKGWTITLS